jgi:two-component system, NtrC family, sensor kinase
MTNPVLKRDVAAPEGAGGPAAEAAKAFPILYVDDEPHNLLTLRYALEERFTVLTARSGHEAVELLEREDVAVLLCDQRMPEMSGIEVCRRARQIKPDVVRIIVTAYADMQAAMDAINQGQVLKYLTKPWRNEELVEVLDSAIELVRMRRTLHEMQVRMLKGGGHSPVVEGVIRQIAGELQTPVSKLEMNAGQLEDLLEAGLSSWDSAERARELIEHAREAQRDALRPIEELRKMVDRMARGQRLAGLPARATCDAVRVAQASARILGSVLESQARVQLVIAGTPVVAMDPAELGQVLVHLVMNAAQALERMSHPERALITLQVAESGPNAEITVSDSGPGMTTEQLQRAFDPYYTTRKGAAGMGLSVVKHLVSQAGGTVVAESLPARGARFTVRLPNVAAR